jgi:hypothetical protein
MKKTKLQKPEVVESVGAHRGNAPPDNTQHED